MRMYYDYKDTTIPSGVSNITSISPGPARILQVALEFSSDKGPSAINAYFIIEYDQVPIEYPSFSQAEQTVGLQQAGDSLLSVVRYEVDKAYGYTLLMNSAFDNIALVKVSNVAQKTVRVKCLVLYER